MELSHLKAICDSQTSADEYFYINVLFVFTTRRICNAC